MQDLRLVGVHDDGEHLLLSGTGGDVFRLPIDEALRVAASRASTRLRTASAQATTAESGSRLSPRDIQMQIRAGDSAEAVAAASGLPLAHIQRYEGPVVAEREYVARQARAIELSAPIPPHDGYRSAFGDNPATLEEMVSYRLAAFGIDPDSVLWDAWRHQDGTWMVTADFESSAAGAAASIGEPAPAQWTFSPGRKIIRNANRWAQQLSEIEPLDGPLPARRLSAVADRPFDFETDAALPLTDAAHVTEAMSASVPNEAEGLLDMLRARRGQRLGVDEDDDDALAVLLTNGIPAAHPRPGAEDAPGSSAAQGPKKHDDEAARSQDATAAGTATRGAADQDSPAAAMPEGYPSLTLAPRSRNHEDALRLHEVSTETREIRISAAPKTTAGEPGKTAAETPTGEGINSGGSAAGVERADRRTAIKPKRSSVPSWDEIVFGTKSD
ncbi:DUF3071 domain-containing protein [Paenarthrobacter sp. Z7-10]|uniref:septation protein SepH n=1 Tax=Paenarthrobacter sp. Z7-10 TaxID=2787635 RepID=UPI0022A97E59|nr:septation protein SepH [Paenarthrobacter sp. Z7-10]MCZ2403766.1 DUF3071 domain-containing protein [Paenarthrobacter sp. Z7-10]